MKAQKSIILFLVSIITFYSCLAQNNETPKVFYFGKKINTDSGIAINNPQPYNNNTGYGFDFQSAKNVNFNNASINGNGSIYFSVKLSEGNYKIDITLGGSKPSETTIKAESKRLMAREIKVAENDTSHYSFIVNVRTPKINNNLKINIKDRELDDLNWDNKLTLEFSEHPAIKTIRITQIPQIRTLFLAGDSTVTDQDLEPWASWGQFITMYFDNNIVIANYAASGASLSSFIARNRLEKILSVMQPGDYLFIEFGHNDEKIKGEGNGAWGLYTNLLREFVTKSREKGGIPVLVTPTQRRFFEANGKLKPTHGDYPNAMRKVAIDLEVPLIDLTKMTTDMYEVWGDDISRKAFVQYPANTFPGQIEALEDNTHFNSFGANEIAKCVVQGIKDLNLDISKNIRPNIPFYNPKKPDNFNNWTVPMSTRFENKKPDGN
ncbi:MAG TPA: rhamnogalacturonan acetylesterase [Flavobacteriaceae bacterium]